MSFSMDSEKGDKLSFLEMKVVLEHGKFASPVY